MSFSELFLRLGSALVAWMLVYTHGIWLATLRTVGCTSGTEFWVLLLALAPLAVAGAWLIRVSRRLPEVHGTLAWLAAPLLLLLLPLALHSLWPTLQTATFGQQAICAAGSAPAWQQLWAPAQLLTVLLVALLTGRNFWLVRRSGHN